MAKGENSTPEDRLRRLAREADKLDSVILGIRQGPRNFEPKSRSTADKLERLSNDIRWAVAELTPKNGKP